MLFFTIICRASATTLPAPGYRACGAGTQSSVGNDGYSWTSTVTDTDGIRLGFSVTWFDSSSTGSRAYGFQLRCLSE
ncbi:hypothetical protein [uncultured Rikenella sp.]|uniref:hypothetical protein n=1 Tax=uncultured Rikenella sp. TaxID=368003 RepID=UPI0026039E4F|nr:hypothetical protein [uncultured Rikenella sp.]